MALLAGLFLLPAAVLAAEADDGFDTLMGMAEAPAAAAARPCHPAILDEELALHEVALAKPASLGCKALAGQSAAAQKLVAKAAACGADLKRRATQVVSALGKLEEERCAVARAGGVKAAQAILAVGLDMAEQRKGGGAKPAGGASRDGASLPRPGSVQIPEINTGVAGDARYKNSVAGTAGLCPLVRIKGAVFLATRWHIDHSTKNADLFLKRTNVADVGWFDQQRASEEIDENSCALQYKDLLNIAVSDNAKSLRHVSQLIWPAAKFDLLKSNLTKNSAMNVWTFLNDPGTRVWTAASKCDADQLFGAKREIYFGSDYPHPVHLAGAPIFAFEDTLKYLRAYKKALDNPEEKINENFRYFEKYIYGKSDLSKSRLYVGNLIKVFECHKKEGYPFARENALAIVRALDGLRASESKVMLVNETPIGD